MRRLAVWALAVAAVLLTGGTVTARAATDGRIDSITQQGDTLSILFSATSLAPGLTVDPDSVAVTVGGVPVKTVAKPFADSDAAEAGRTVVLALDTSGSMAGPGLAGAKTAANLFLRQVPADVRVGVVAFADSAEVVVRPTDDRNELATKIRSLQAEGDTALYDGVITAARLTATTGARSVVVLSDGVNDGGSATFAQATRVVRSSGVALDAVALGSGGAQATKALSALATAGSGQVFGARETSDLSAAFAATAASLNSQLLVSAVIPADAGRTTSVAVTASAGDVSVSDSAATLIQPRRAAGQAAAKSGPQAVASGAAWLTETWFAGLALALIFLGAVILLVIALSGSDTREGRVARRLSSYDLTTGTLAKAASDRSSDVARTAVELAGRVTAKRDMDQMLGLRLEAAGLPLKPAEWLLIHLGFTVGGLFLLGLLTGFRLIPLLIGLAVGFLAPYAFLAIKASRRRAEFEQTIPDMLTLVAGSLSAGHSIMQAFDAVVRESSGVVKEELSRAIVEARLGVPVDDALQAVAERMQSKDFGWIVMAIRVNRQIGGDLAEVLRNVAGMLRERERVRRQVKTLSAEGRLSAYILVGLPIVFATYMFVMRPDYVELLYTTVLGLALTGSGLLAMVVGAIWMSRIIKIDI